MMRIEGKFNSLRREGRKGLIPYITAGDPSLEATPQIILVLGHSDADTTGMKLPAH
jgi:tryptophan synthase alpha chain